MLFRLRNPLRFTFVCLIFFLISKGGSAQLAGEYFIPQGDEEQGFESLEEAFDALNNEGASGMVFFLIGGDLDDEENLLINRGDLSEDTQVFVQPAHDTAVHIQVTGEGIRLENTAWITFDGAGNNDDNTDPDGSQRLLAFNFTDAANAFHISGTSHNIRLANLQLTREETFVNHGVLINAGGSHLRLDNLEIGSGEAPFTHGVGVEGAGFDEPASADVLNSIMYVRWRGIRTLWVTNSNFESNSIHSMGTANIDYYTGFYLAGFLDGKVQKNMVFIRGANSVDQGDRISGILVNSTGELLIANNFITITEDFTDHADNGHAGMASINGIEFHREYEDTSYINIYHNTIRLSAMDYQGRTAAIGWTEDEETGEIPAAYRAHFDIRNNILINEIDAANAYSLDWSPPDAGNADGSFLSDYNNLFSAGANVAHFAGDDLQDLPDWQSASGQDGNSVSKTVDFLAADSPELSGDSEGDPELHGTPETGITDDIFGRLRDGEHPFMGAYEGGEPVGSPVTATFPEKFVLHQNFPNPFNPVTVIRYEVPAAIEVTLEIFSVTGQHIQTLIDHQHQNAGIHEIRFDATGLASGIYIYKLRAGEFRQSKTMTLIK